MLVFTTGQVAEICRVAPRTVAKWIDNGLLGGHRLPGGGDRRIRLLDLWQFLQENDMPYDPRPALLLVSRDGILAEHLQDELDYRYQVVLAENSLDAGAAIAEFRPETILVDLAVDENLLTQIANSKHQAGRLFAVIESTDQIGLVPKHAQIFTKPFDIRLLIGLIDVKQRAAA